MRTSLNSKQNNVQIILVTSAELIMIIIKINYYKVVDTYNYIIVIKVL